MVVFRRVPSTSHTVLQNYTITVVALSDTVLSGIPLGKIQFFSNAEAK